MHDLVTQGHTARKRFGQNFLQDQNVIAGIVKAINPSADDNIVEIGPGLAALTTPVSEKVNKLHVIELDRDLAQRLRENPFLATKLEIHETDALKFDFSTLGSKENPIRIFGNLPYNISTPLMIHLFSQANVIKDMHFMLQKEVVNRLAAAPDSKDYGRLSVITFHSLEDRIVKQRMAKWCEGCTCPKDFPICVCGNKPKAELIFRKPVEADEKEQEENPRSRSAKLRCCKKL